MRAGRADADPTPSGFESGTLTLHRTFLKRLDQADIDDST